MLANKRRLLLWRIVTVSVLSSMLVLPMPSRLYSAPNAWSAPDLLEPESGVIATVVNYPPAAVPLFEWQAVTGATRYRIQIDDDFCAFSDPIRYDKTTPNTKYIPTTNSAFADGSGWCWRVRVEQPSPVGDWSEARQFTKDWGASANAPQLLSPDAGTDVEFFESPVFSWSPVTGAAEYVLKIDNDFGCPSPAYSYTTPATHYNPSGRFANGNYYWCVTPRNANGKDGETSESRSMTVQYSQVPQLLEPANTSEPVYTPAFRWTAIKGATGYKLYYSTDPTFVANVSTVTTDQTSYTPHISLPNDQTYFWRVSAIYGSNWEGPFSTMWSFTKRWYHQPVLLTPRNNELVNVALFTWTPVREARRYKFEMSFDPGFATIKRSADTANTFYWEDYWDGSEWEQTMYWRVTPYDYNNNPGKSSEVKSFRPTLLTSLPENIWPRYFYEPPFEPTGNYVPPYDIPTSFDYTVDTPTFYWSRTLSLDTEPREEAHYYRLEVDDNPNFTDPEWVIETENLSATPTDGNPFTPLADTNYYWRITPLDAGGAILSNSAQNQPWLTQIDISRQVTPTATSSPTLRLPTDGEKVMETLPSFEWLPQEGAVRYELAISDDPAFGTSTYVTRTTYTRHTPVVRVPLGTYFWRVRGLDGSDNTVGQWSEVRRIIVARQSRWLGASDFYTLGSLPEHYSTLLAADVDDGLGATELISLYTAQDKDYWYVGFHVDDTPGATWYGLYLDGDQAEGEGAAFAPPNRPNLTTSAYYQPEYAIYFTGFAGDPIYLHSWDTATADWDPQIRNLVDPVQIGGAFYYSATLNYVELKIPKTAIGDEGDKPFSLSVALFSATSSTAATASDTVPDNGASTSVLTEFKTIGDRVSLAVPSGGLQDAYAELPYTPHMVTESPNTDYLGGYKFEISRDPLFTSVIQSLNSNCVGCESVPHILQYVFSPQNILEDNTLYWRYSIRHRFSSVYYNAPPSEPHLFTKTGPSPENLRIEGDYSTPRFVWDAVEGAGNYQFELATNSDFSPLKLQKDVNHESYTPREAYQPGIYYWRVRAENTQSPVYASDWAVASSFEITLPFVSLVEPVMADVVRSNPTLRWDPALIPGSESVYGWGAPRYRLQIANSPDGFPSPFENVILDTTSWTPTKSYPDDTYYWRVAVRDASNYDGPFSEVYTFTKQSPVVTLVSPITGTLSGEAYPTFIWEPIDGAARYKIQISTDSNFGSMVDNVTTDNVIFTPTKEYATDQYYWRVAMIDKFGNYGPWTDSILLIDPLPYRVFLPFTIRNH